MTSVSLNVSLIDRNKQLLTTGEKQVY